MHIFKQLNTWTQVYTIRHALEYLHIFFPRLFRRGRRQQGNRSRSYSCHEAKTFKRAKNKCNYNKQIKDDSLLSYSWVTKSNNTQVWTRSNYNGKRWRQMLFSNLDIFLNNTDAKLSPHCQQPSISHDSLFSSII